MRKDRGVFREKVAFKPKQEHLQDRVEMYHGAKSEKALDFDVV